MIFYRFDEILRETGKEVYLIKFELLKETPKGYWIKEDFGFKKWVSKTAKKRFAYPTKKEALINLIKRKERQIRILESRLNEAKNVLKEGQTLLNIENLTIKGNLE